MEFLEDGKTPRPCDAPSKESSFIYCPLFALFPYKRITEIVRDYEEGLYNYHIEERWPNTQVLKGFQNIDKFKNYLSNTNQMKAVLLGLCIDNLIHFTTELQKVCSYIEGSMYDINYDEDTDARDFVQLEVKIGEETLEQIKKNPHVVITKRCGLKDGRGNLVTLGHNELWVKLLGIESPGLHDENEGFDAFRSLSATNWIEFSLAYINFYIDHSTSLVILPKNLLTLNSMSRQSLIKDISLHKNQYLSGGNLMSEIYINFELIGGTEVLATLPEKPRPLVKNLELVESVDLEVSREEDC